MTEPHFELIETNAAGEHISSPVRVFTEAGVFLHVPGNADVQQIRHLLAIAYAEPGTPVDLTAWRGDQLTWSARVRFLLCTE